MKEYTSYCTELQTVSMYDLGAPIETYYERNQEIDGSKEYWLFSTIISEDIDGHEIYGFYPTHEQFFNWVEETYNIYIAISVNKKYSDKFSAKVYRDDMIIINQDTIGYHETRDELKNNIIDCILEYLLETN